MKACIIYNGQTGAINTINWEDNLSRSHDEKTNKDRGQNTYDNDKNNEGGFGVDVGSHL